MNDRQIQAFLAICEAGSMNRAAEKLFISQPALKKRIDVLETEMGVPLLKRNSEGCEMTEAGRVFYKGILPIYEQVGELLRDVRRVKDRQRLRVCTLQGMSLEGQDEVMISFAQKNPDVLVEWVPLPTSRWIDAVSEGEADMCSSLMMEDEVERFNRTDVCVMPTKLSVNVMCVCSVRHPLAQKSTLRMEDLRGYEVHAGPLLYYSGGLREYALRNGLNIIPDDNAGKRYDVIDQCEKGKIYVHAGDYAGSLRPLAVRPVSGFTCRSCWIWNRGSSLIVKRFLDEAFA